MDACIQILFSSADINWWVLYPAKSCSNGGPCLLQVVGSLDCTVFWYRFPYCSAVQEVCCTYWTPLPDRGKSGTIDMKQSYWEVFLSVIFLYSTSLCSILCFSSTKLRIRESFSLSSSLFILSSSTTWLKYCSTKKKTLKMIGGCAYFYTLL